MHTRYKGQIALFSAATLYGFFGVFSKLISFNLPFFYQAWVRNVFSILIIGILVLTLRKWKHVEKRDHVWLLLRGICGFISFIGIYIAFTGLDIGTTYFLSYAATVISGYLLGMAVFKEKLTKRGVVCFICVLVGLFFIYRVSVTPSTFPFILLAIISGLAGPGWNAFSKKISSTYSNIQLNFIDSIYAFIFPFVISLFLHEKWTPITLSPIWFYTFLFALMFLLTGLLIVYGFKYVSAQAGTIILLFEIIAGILLGFIFFHETISLAGYIGGAFILLAIVLRSFDQASN